MLRVAVFLAGLKLVTEEAGAKLPYKGNKIPYTKAQHVYVQKVTANKNDALTYK